MKENQVQQDLASIRSMMERSSKFLSLSGLSGILAGVYALIGAAAAYQIIYKHVIICNAPAGHPDPLQIVPLFVIALIVLAASVLTGFLLSRRKARKAGQRFWGPTSKALAFNLAVPVITGGLLIIMLISRSYFDIIAPASLIFYGLALIGAGNFTFKGVQYLGLNEIILGLLAVWLPDCGLIIWALGFGVLHILYGSMMYFKYDK